MFTVLEALSDQRDEMAPVLYRNLVTIYIQLNTEFVNHRFQEQIVLLREHMMHNFSYFFKNKRAPISIMLDPYFK